MPGKTKIEWTTATWNPITGCHKVSPGCKYCYAETFAERWRGIPGHAYENGFDLQLRPERLSGKNTPDHWTKPQLIFVNSMSDLWHEGVPIDYIQRVFEVMNRVNQHTYQILTKREQRLSSDWFLVNWTANIWQGVSVETAEYKHRIDHLRQVPAAVRFLSLEPLLGPLGTLDLTGIHWVIVGGESGRNARPMDVEWVREIREQCLNADVPFFFKQWGGTNKKAAGRLLDGRTWDEMPRSYERV